MELMKEARAALINAVGRVGAPLSGDVPALLQLRYEGLASWPGYNLTRKGVIARARALDEMLDAL